MRQPILSRDAGEEAFVHAAGGAANWLSLSEEQTGSPLSVQLGFIPLDLLIPLGDRHPKEITSSPLHLLQNTFTKLFKTKN